MWCANSEDVEQTQRERKTNAPQRLPPTRPRALTFICPEKSDFDQSQSALLARLPAEVRRLIWLKVLGGHLLHIARAPKRLLAIDCADKVHIGSDLLETRFHACWGVTRRQDTTPGFYISPRDHPSRPANLLPLLQTCRRVYSEAISILYQDNVFDINHLDTLIYLRQSVLPQRLNQIRTLNLIWDFKWPTATSRAPYDLATWQEACNILATFTGLQELTVYLTGENDLTAGTYWKDRWGPLLETLAQIESVKFDVFIPWTEEECAKAEKDGGYPFRLVSKIQVMLPLDEYCSDSDIEAY